MPITLAGGVATTRTRTVTKHPRYPELTSFAVSNGTHEMSWVEFNERKYHCSYKDGSSQQTAATASPKSIRYDGFTWYESIGRGGGEFAALKYKIEYTNMNIEYFASVNNINKPMGMQRLACLAHAPMHEWKAQHARARTYYTHTRACTHASARPGTHTHTRS